jgi:hypothetical protein
LGIYLKKGVKWLRGKFASVADYLNGDEGAEEQRRLINRARGNSYEKMQNS